MRNEQLKPLCHLPLKRGVRKVKDFRLKILDLVFMTKDRYCYKGEEVMIVRKEEEKEKSNELEISDEIKQILEKLNYIDPPIKKFPVTPEDPSMTISLVDLKDVCYITTKSTAGREETGFVTSNNKTYYSNLRLTEIEKKLAVHPHFMRTSKFYMVNLTKIRALRVSSARDLWFEGLEEPIINAVTSTYLSEFLERMKL